MKAKSSHNSSIKRRKKEIKHLVSLGSGIERERNDGRMECKWSWTWDFVVAIA